LPICGLATFNVTLVPDVAGGDFTWTASCLPAGTVTGFTATQATNVTAINDMLNNTTADPATVTYAITPHAFGCDGPVTDYTVTLQPTPHLTNGPPAAICSGSPFNASLLSDVAGTSFTWTATSNPVGAITGFTATQAIATTLIDETMLTNSTSGFATVTYQITPFANGCNGPATDFTITVKPTPHFTNSAPAPICSGDLFNASLLSDVTGGNFTWTATCSPIGAITGFTASQATGVTLISDPLTNLTTAPATVTYHLFPQANGCDGPASDFTVTVNPTPHLTNSPPVPICSGEVFNASLLSDVTGSNFTWTATCTPIGSVTGFTAIQGTGVTSIKEALTNTTNDFATVTYQLIPHANNCDGPATDFTVTVKPTPHVTTAPLTQSFCSGGSTNIPITGDVAGNTFTWTAVPSSPNLGGYLNGLGNSIIQPLTNSGFTTETVTYEITPSANGCVGPVSNFVVTVYPIPDISNDPQWSQLCNSSSTNINLTSHVANPNFSWTCTPSSANITGFLPGAGTLIDQVLVNSGFSTESVTYHITPTANGCPGQVVDWVATVVSLPDVYFSPAVPVICSQATTNIQVLSHVLTSTFTWTATGSDPHVSGYSNGIGPQIAQPLTNTDNIAHTVSYTATPTAFGCPPGLDNTVMVTVNPTPHVSNNPLKKSICSAASTNIPLTSTVSGSGFSWTASSPYPNLSGYSNDNGLAINQNLVNTGFTIDTVYYTIIPTANTCPGPDSTFKVAVYPVPDLSNNPPSKAQCSGQPTAITLTSHVAGTQFTWTATGSSGFVSGFSDNLLTPATLLDQTLVNSGFNIETVTYHLTPHANGCDGLISDYTVTVYPTPDLSNTPAAKSQCNNLGTAINLTSNIAGTSFTWTATGSSGQVSGYSNNAAPTNVINQTLSNSGSAIETVTYHLIPSTATCTGSNTDFVVTVFPTPTLTNSPAFKSQCNNTATGINLTSAVAGTLFTWTATGSSGQVSGFASNAIPASLINQTLTNTSFINQTVTYHLTPEANTCIGTAADYTVTVYPTPDLSNNPPSKVQCSNVNTAVNLTSNIAGTLFTWTCIPSSANVTGWSNETIPSGTINQTLVNTGNINESVTYQLTPIANGCNGTATNFTVTVYPVPAISCPAGQSICSGSSTSAVTLISTVTGTDYSWSATCPVGSVNPCPVAPGTSNPIGSVAYFNVTDVQQTVTYTVASSFMGCPGTTATHVVTINPSPTVTNWPLEQTLCSGITSTPVNLTATVVGTTFTWTASTSSPITGIATSGTDNIPAQTLSIPAGVSGFVTYHIIPSFTGGPSCPGAPTDYVIHVNPLPTPDITGSTLVCELQPNVTYTTPLVAGHSYNWVVTGATGVANANTNAVTVTWGPYTASPGSVVVTETIDATGCPKTTAPKLVTLQQRPIPTLAGSQDVCDGATGKIYQTEAGMANYTWSVTGGSFTSGGGAGSPSATVTWNTPGIQTIEVNYINALGCPGFPAKQLPVTVHTLPVTTITEGTGPNCESAPHSYSVPADPLCTYVWTITPSGRGLISSGQGTSNLTIDWQSFGAAVISVTGTNNTTTCVSSSTHPLTIHPKPLPSFTPCFGLTTTTAAKKFTLRGASPYVASQGVYSGNRVSLNIVSGNYEFDPFGASPGAYPVMYTFTNNFGCIASAGPVYINVQNSFFSCGGDLTDVRDSKTYKTTMVAGRCWMAQNLAYGTTLDPPSQPQTDNCINEKYCLTTDPTCTAYGALYQWDELMQYGFTSGNQGICPPEWHLPTEAEWQVLINNISTGAPTPADALAAGFLKDPLLNPGFFALFEGIYYVNNNWSFTTGSLTATMYWTATVNAQNQPLARGMNFFNPSVSRYWSSRGNAFSVRCVKD
jgi:uncharacterized protein (TIGR02145 family)